MDGVAEEESVTPAATQTVSSGGGDAAALPSPTAMAMGQQTSVPGAPSVDPAQAKLDQAKKDANAKIIAQGAADMRSAMAPKQVPQAYNVIFNQPKMATNEQNIQGQMATPVAPAPPPIPIQQSAPVPYGAPVAVSDQRAKKNIKPVRSAQDFLESIKDDFYFNALKRG